MGLSISGSKIPTGKNITGFLAYSMLIVRFGEIRQTKWYKLVEENDIRYNVVNWIYPGIDEV